jgi:acetamidase/formamidase
MGGENRAINGHYFIQPVDMPSSMVAGSVAFRQGFGVLTAELPTLASVGAAKIGRGKLQYEQKNIFLYGQRLAGTIGILNRVGIDLYAGGTAAVGGDMDAVVLLGAIAHLEVGAMPKVRIFTLDDVGLQVTLGVGVGYAHNIHISPYMMISSTIDSLTKDASLEAQIIQQTKQVDVTPTLMVAEGVGPFGAQVFARPVIGVAGTAPGNALDWGAHLAFDVGRLTQWFPVAITAEYMMNYPFAGGSMRHNPGGGFYYTGRRDFSLGLVGQAQIEPQPDGTSLNMYLGQMTLQYYF